MKSAMEIYKEAKKCAKEHNAENDIKCLKRIFLIEIGGDHELLLAYKAKTKNIIIPEILNIFLSTAAFIVSIYTLAINILIEEFKASDQYIFEILCVLLIILIVVIIVVAIELFYIVPYKTMEIVLEDIEKEMEEKGI